MFDARKPMSTFIEKDRLNGFDSLVMQSDLYTNRIISIFKTYVEKGADPNAVQYQVYHLAGVKNFNNDILDCDKLRIKKAVEQMYNNRY